MHHIHNQPAGSSDEAQAFSRAARRKRYEAILKMIGQWQVDQSGYEERIWPDLKQQIEAHRLSSRGRFRD